jgi:hypothetical protein
VRYFVIGDDGQKYGPADIATLQSWVGEGRLLPTQQVEEEGSGIRMAASAINGLKFPHQAPPGPQQPAPGAYQQPPAGTYQPPMGGVPSGSPYNRPMGPQVIGDGGTNDLTLAWVLGAVGAVLCCLGIFIQPFALMAANRAIAKGNPGGNAARIFCIVFLVLSILLDLYYIAVFIFAISTFKGLPPPTPVR